MMIIHVKLKPTYASPLEKAVRVVLSAHLLQETFVVRTVAVEGTLPAVAIIQIPVRIRGAMGRCIVIDTANDAFRSPVHQLVVGSVFPYNGEKDNDEGFCPRIQP